MEAPCTQRGLKGGELDLGGEGTHKIGTSGMGSSQVRVKAISSEVRCVEEIWN